MYITKVAAENFRTLCNFQTELKPGYCAISGKNNSGKTSIIKVIQYFLSQHDDDPFSSHNSLVVYARDKTQWVDDNDLIIKLAISISISEEDDSEIFAFIRRFSEDVGESGLLSLRMETSIDQMGIREDSCFINENPQDVQASNEIFKKMRATKTAITHNSTSTAFPYFFRSGSFVEFIEAQFSPADRQGIATAQSNLRRKIRKATKQHKEHLDGLLGKLKERYSAELTSLDSERSSKFPLQITLSDNAAEVPLQGWGAGTQNRTRVFVSILEAQHFKTSASEDDRLSPIFLVEEPESFLHPSAQAEFGLVLNELARDFKIQIIATTHSPYMLNQVDPQCNYLLDRRLTRGKQRDSYIVNNTHDQWMMPFAQNLGLVTSEFHDWKEAFTSQSSCIILVEGAIDKEYFEYIRDNYPDTDGISDDVEVVPYEGKDALKNTALLRFMANKFKKLFVTYDLDADKDVRQYLEKVGLIDGQQFLAIGINKNGMDSIEGLLPETLRRSVHETHYDDVNALLSGENSVRVSARSNLKRAYLDEFKRGQIPEQELLGFKQLFSKISLALRK